MARVRSRAISRWRSVRTVDDTSLPHQPPPYGVSSGKPASSAISGPTSVPCRVMTPSIAASRQLMRRMTLSSSRAMSPACASQSAWDETKNVV